MASRIPPGCAKPATLGLLVLLLAASVSVVGTVVIARMARLEVERRYEREFGSLNITQLLPPEDGAGQHEVAKLRAAMSSMETLETIDAELKRLAKIAPDTWTTEDANLVRKAAVSYRDALEALSSVDPTPSDASLVDLDALDTSGDPSDKMIHVSRLSRLARLAANEAALRGDTELASRLARGMLASAPYLERSPHRLYRAFGEVMERSGMLLLQRLIDRFDRLELQEIASAFPALRLLPDSSSASQVEALAFYHHGVAKSTPRYLPTDLGRVLWLRCESAFRELAHGNFADALSKRDAMLARSDLREAICRKFVGMRVDEVVREALMRRLRNLGRQAIELRTGETSSETLTEREPWSGRFFDELPMSSVDDVGAVLLTDESLAAAPAAAEMADPLRKQFEALARWRVELPGNRPNRGTSQDAQRASP